MEARQPASGSTLAPKASRLCRVTHPTAAERKSFFHPAYFSFVITALRITPSQSRQHLIKSNIMLVARTNTQIRKSETALLIPLVWMANLSVCRLSHDRSHDILLRKLTVLNVDQVPAKLRFNGSDGGSKLRLGIKAYFVERRCHVVLLEASKLATIAF